MENNRKCCFCEIKPIKNHSKQKIKTLRENSFQMVGPNLFNCLPSKIRSLSKCSIDDFKSALDQFLAKIPDEPKLPGYIPAACDQFSGQPSNSLVDQIQNTTKL